MPACVDQELGSELELLRIEEPTSALGVLCVCIKMVRLLREVLGARRDDG